WQWMNTTVRGDMGRARRAKGDERMLHSTRIWAAVCLGLGRVLLASLLAVPLATRAARNKGSWCDNLIRVFTTTGLGMPAFWLGFMLILMFSVQLGWFPASRYGSDWLDKVHPLVLPCLTIALALSAALSRNPRASMHVDLPAGPVTAARVRGLRASALVRGPAAHRS
ncbi:ABC transporter permease, partial [Pseudomonas syringae]